MQDIEALTERILLIGKGRILLDGTLAELKKRNFKHKTLVVDYIGDNIGDISGVHFIKELDGHAELVVDTTQLPVSKVIAAISAKVEVIDISVTGTTAEEMVVLLYKEFEI